MPVRRLVLLRHAKSAYPVGVADHERPLSARGERDSRAAMDWFADHGRALLGADPKILVSTAVRTQQTWRGIEPAFPGADVESCAEIYEAAVSTLIDLCSPVMESGRDILLVGHNPGLELLADFLGDPARSDPVWSQREKYPTAGIAVLAIEGQSWARDSARVEAFVVPRG